MKSIIFIFVSVASFYLSAHARVRIALLESYTKDGKLVQYEVGGRFYHSAIWVDAVEVVGAVASDNAIKGGGWLQSYPPEGVSVISWQQLQEKGKVAVILDLPKMRSITLNDYKKYLGKKFDFYYQWNDDLIYCSELIAKILNIQTVPMKLNHQVWPKNYWVLDGQPGVSPDELYRWSIKNGAIVHEL